MRYSIPLLLCLVVLASCVEPIPPVTGTCGDGMIDSGEECDEGVQNGVVCDPDGGSCTYCSETCELNTVDVPDRFEGLAWGIGASQEYLNGNAPEWDSQTYRSLLAADLISITGGARLDGLRLDGLNAPVRWESLDAQVERIESLGKEAKIHYLWNGRAALLPDGFFELEPLEREAWMLDHARMIAERYKGRVAMYDVVNHPIRDGDALDYLGTNRTKVEAIDTIFRQTREIDPDAVLVINEGGVLIDNSDIWPATAGNEDEYYALVEELLERSTPIDCIGFMTHAISGDFDAERAERVLDRFASLGVPLCITEFDVDYPDRDAPYDPQDPWWFEQGVEYEEAYALFSAHPAVKSVITWELSDHMSGRMGTALVTYNDPRLIVEDDSFLVGANTRDRTVEIRFEPGENPSRAVLYEEGGESRGISIYLDDGIVHAYLWNDGASGPTFEPLHLFAPLAGARTITLTHLAGSETTLALDGMVVDSGVALGIYPHRGVTIAGADFTRFHDEAFGTWGYHYVGTLDSVRVTNDGSQIIDLDFTNLDGFDCAQCPALIDGVAVFEDHRYERKPSYEAFEQQR